jgi:methylisocitrate lyase
MIFAEAVTELAQYTEFRKAVGVPILANITEFGRRRCSRAMSLKAAGVDIILYCCGAYRAMNAAALKVYEAIRAEGTQKERGAADADARRALQVSRLPRVRAEAG